MERSSSGTIDTGADLVEPVVDDKFAGVRVRDTELRVRAIEQLLAELQELGESSPEELDELLPTVARLAHECPYEDVRSAMEEMLEYARGELGLGSKVRAPYASASLFLTLDKGVLAREDTEGRLQGAFSATGRLGNDVAVLSLHPEFLEAWVASSQAVFEGRGGLPLAWRHFLGLAAAARHGCLYVACRHLERYLACGGDESWLKSDCTDENRIRLVQTLGRLNAKLAHRPWEMETEDIATAAANGWTLTQLTHAIVILVFVHGECSLAMGCGLLPEVDLSDWNIEGFGDVQDISGDVFFGGGGGGGGGGKKSPGEDGPTDDIVSGGGRKTIDGPLPQKISDDLLSGGGGGGRKTIDGPLPQKISHDLLSPPQTISAAEGGGGPSEAEQRAKEALFRGISSQEEEEEKKSKPEKGFFEAAGSAPEIKTPEARLSDLSTEGWIGGPLPPSYHYTDFSDTKSPVFKTSQFSWEGHAHGILSRFFPTVAPLLDREFDVIYRLTYNTFGLDDGIDTEPFRRSVWYYVMRLFGVFHEDFYYAIVNKLLVPRVKGFCKMVACVPESIKHTDFFSFSTALTPAEKVHVVLLCIGARKRASLLWALRAVAQHYST